MKTIPLTQGLIAQVDDADFKAVNRFKWCAQRIGRNFYAARRFRKPDGKQGYQYLHQFLFPGVLRVDHRDGDGLNNQRYNLRPATNQQNLWGFQRKRPGATSKFRGVSWESRRLTWHARLKISGKSIHLGYFDDETDAACAYDTAAIKYFGEFASPNFKT